MVNNHGPIPMAMHLEPRVYGDIARPTDDRSDLGAIILDGPTPTAPSSEEQSEAASTSDGLASPSPYPTTSSAFPDISAPADINLSASRKFFYDSGSNTIQGPEPTTASARNSGQPLQATNQPSPAPQSHSRPSNTRTVAIVVPIVAVILVIPFLIFWYLSCRRRKRSRRSRLRHQSPPQTAILEKRMQENLARARNEWSPESLFATKNTTDLASPANLPSQRAQRPRSAHQFRTSDPPDNSLSGFNFDFSRRATTSSKRGAQRPLPDPSNRRSSSGSWEPNSPYSSRSAAFSPPYLPTDPPIPPSPSAGISQPDEQFPPGSEASLGLLVGEKAESSSRGHDISPALSLHEERSPYGASNQPLSDAISEISGLSVDPDPWPPGSQSARHFKSRSEVSAMEPYPRPDHPPI